MSPAAIHQPPGVRLTISAYAVKLFPSSNPSRPPLHLRHQHVILEKREKKIERRKERERTRDRERESLIEGFIDQHALWCLE